MRCRPTLVLALVAAAALWSAPAAADDLEEAKKLFDRARALSEAGNHEEACPLYEQTFALTKGIGAQYQLARCYEETGRLASAHEAYREVADVTQRAGQHDRHDVAMERATALEPRLITLQITSAPSDGTVTLDGTPLAATSVYVDPGSHEVVLERADGTRETKRIEARDEGSTVTVAFEATAADATTADTPPDAGDGSSSDALFGVGLGAVGVGVAALAVGGGFGIAAMQTHSESEEPANCDDSGCTPRGLELISEARDQANVATGLMIAGAVLATAGVVVAVIAVSDDSENAAEGPSEIAFTAGPAQAGLRLRF